MNILIIILSIIAALVAIPLIIALFVKKEYTVDREIIVNKPKQEVFDYIKYIRNQDYYSKWVMMDPSRKKIFIGTDGTEGFIYGWDSNNKNAGKGEQEIKLIVEGVKIETEIRFVKPFEGIGHSEMITEGLSSDQTKVEWKMVGKNKYPMNFLNLFIGNLLSKDMDTSLNMLKQILERN